MTNIYNQLSKERKELQEQGLVPKWYSTAGYQMFKDKYEYETNGQSVKGQFERIAKTAANHLKDTPFQDEAEEAFFILLWNGWLSPSTPVLANMGTSRGMPVSCSGTIAGDSVDGFYSNLHEVAMLTKYGFGTATDLSNIRPRGSKISVGGKASGVLPIVKEHVSAMRNIAQGTARRGAWACYLNIEHGDFNELVEHVMAEPDDLNVGWTIHQTFIDRLNSGDTEAVERFQRAMKVKMVTGKGYFFFIDKANAKRPTMYKDRGLFINNSQLCSEIMLFNDLEHTYTCVLSSMNAAKWEEWKDTDAVYWATIFLDCVAEEFIQRAKGVRGLEKAVRFTEKSRALGLGLAGIHTLFMQKMLPFESLDAHLLSQNISSNIRGKAQEATKDMAKIAEIALKAQQHEEFLEESSQKNTADARAMNVSIQTSQFASTLAQNSAYILDFLIVSAAVICSWLAFFQGVPAENKELVYMGLGSLWTMAGTVVNFHRGSSRGSQNKDAVIDKISSRL